MKLPSVAALALAHPLLLPGCSKVQSDLQLDGAKFSVAESAITKIGRFSPADRAEVQTRLALAIEVG